VESVLDIGGDRKIFGKVRRREVVAEQKLETLKAKRSPPVSGRVKTSHSWARSKPAGERKIS
jgi:hypothetical protein